MNNGFTTQEESKMLITYGLPSRSADCRYELNKETSSMDIVYGYKRFHLPCWTTGRLIEIDMLYRKNHNESAWSFYRNDPQPIKDFVVKTMYERLQNNEYDFSKLLEEGENIKNKKDITINIDVDAINKITPVDTKKLIEILTSGQQFEIHRDSRGCDNIIFK